MPFDSVEESERKKIADEKLENHKQLMPSLFKRRPIHDSAEAEGCDVLFSHCFCFVPILFGLTEGGDSLRKALEKLDPISLYSEYKKYLQVLSKGSPKLRWVLKSPLHALFCDKLSEVFGEEPFFVHTHREPSKAVSSLASLCKSVNSVYQKYYCPSQLGEKCLLNPITDSILSFRNNMTPKQQERWYDVQYRDLLIDPIPVVKAIYHKFGLEYSKTFEERMRAWLQKNPQFVSGKYTYSIEEFGLNEETVTSKFNKYSEWVEKNKK